MNNITFFQIASIYVGTVIGAGFASGVEIMSFFGRFGIYGFLGIAIATLLFFVIGSVILTISYERQTTSYDELLKILFPSSICTAIDILILLFLLSGYCIMLAGSGALFKEQFGLNYIFGVIIMTIFCLFTFLYSIRGVSIVNTVLVPVLIIGILYIGIFTFVKNGSNLAFINNVPNKFSFNCISSALAYVGYNMIPALVILSSIGFSINKKSTAYKGGLLGGIFLGLLAGFILLPCLIMYSKILTCELPMLYISSKISFFGKSLYFLILFCAMFTTAISNGFGFVNRLSYVINMNEKLLFVLFAFLSIFFSLFGFSNLISVLYPIFGYMSLFIIILVLFKGFNSH